MAKRHQVGIDIETKATGDGVQKTERALDDTRESAKQLRKALDEIEGIDPAARKRVEKLADSLERVEKTGRRVATGMNKGAKSTRKGGAAFEKFTGAVESAQDGISNVLDDLPQLALQMGKSGGLAAAISLAVIGLKKLWEHLTKVEEKFGDSGEEIARTKDRFKALLEEIASADFQAYLTKLDSLQQGIDLENKALSSNIQLLSQKRKAELALAAINDDIELAGIAKRQLTDPNYSDSQAVEDRGGIERRKLGRNQEALEEEKLAEIQDALDRRSIAVHELAETDERLARLARKREEAEVELNDLILQKAAAQKLLDEADKQDEEAGFFSQGKKDLAIQNRDAARENFGVKKQARLDDLKDVIIEGLKADQKSTGAKIEEVRGKITELGVEADATRDSANQAIEESRKLTTAKEALSTLKESNALTTTARSGITKGVADLESQARELAAEDERAAATIRSANETLKSAAKDGLIDAREYQQIAGDLSRVQQVQTAANQELGATVRKLLHDVQTLKSETSNLRATAERQNGNGGL